MKSFLGKSFLGIVRMTFWIGPDGKIRKIWDKVTPKGTPPKCWRKSPGKTRAARAQVPAAARDRDTALHRHSEAFALLLDQCIVN